MQLPCTIIITMAGNGERFRREGYSVPKFMIPANGRTLFHWALRSLSNFFSAGCQIVFVARTEHEPESFIARECEQLGLAASAVVLLGSQTDGQATTALLAGSSILRPAAPALIYNIDTYVEPDCLHPASVRGDGWIPCFPGEGDAWSFAEASPDGLVSRVAEKVRISPHATIGLYWFRSFTLFKDLYTSHFGKAQVSPEKYIAPMYNTLIAEGGSVFVHSVSACAVHPLGTPAEVRAFAANGCQEEVLQ
jgi:hypothetical protein